MLQDLATTNLSPGDSVQAQVCAITDNGTSSTCGIGSGGIIIYCEINTLTLVDTIEDKLYYIGDGPFEWSAIFTESKSGCTVNYELTETGMSAGLYTTDIFSVSTPGDTTANVITVDTADLATYDQTNKVLTLVISLPQNSGATSITISWTVYLQSECHSA